MYGLVKTLKTDDGKEIKLVGNALTFILYKSYFGRDLLNDIVAFAKANSHPDTIKKFSELNVKSAEDIAALDDDKQEELFKAASDYKFDSEFILNFIAALMATSRYPKKIDVIELIMEIPPCFIADDTVITELMEFLSLFITQKKRVP